MCSRGSGKSTQAPSPQAAQATPVEAADESSPAPARPDPKAQPESADPPEEEIPLVVTGLPECDSYIERYLRCKAIPYRERKIQRTTFEAWKEHVDFGGEHAGLGDSCKATTEVQGPSMTKLGC